MANADGRGIFVNTHGGGVGYGDQWYESLELEMSLKVGGECARGWVAS